GGGRGCEGRNHLIDPLGIERRPLLGMEIVGAAGGRTRRFVLGRLWRCLGVDRSRGFILRCLSRRLVRRRSGALALRRLSWLTCLRALAGLAGFGPLAGLAGFGPLDDLGPLAAFGLLVRGFARWPGLVAPRSFVLQH